MIHLSCGTMQLRLAEISAMRFDPDSAQALVRIGADRHASLNKLLEPSGIWISEDEFTLLHGPALAGAFLDRGKVTAAFIYAVVTEWHNGIQSAGVLKKARKASR